MIAVSLEVIVRFISSLSDFLKFNYPLHCEKKLIRTEVCIGGSLLSEVKQNKSRLSFSATVSLTLI